MKNKFALELFASVTTICFSATVFSVLVKAALEFIFPELAIPFFVFVVLYVGIQVALVSVPGAFISTVILYYIGILINPDDKEARDSQNSTQRLAQILLQLLYSTIFLIIGAVILLFL